jgi:hypothetical protein
MISPRHAILGHTHAGGSIWPRLLAFGRRGKPKNPKLLRASFAYRGLAPSPPFTTSGKKDALHSVRSLIGLLSDQSKLINRDRRLNALSEAWIVDDRISILLLSTLKATEYSDTVKLMNEGLKIFFQPSRRCPTHRLIHVLFPCCRNSEHPRRLALIFPVSQYLGSSSDRSV